MKKVKLNRLKRTRKERLVALTSLISALLIIVIGTGLALALNSGMKKLPIKQYFDQSQTNAIWDWSNIQNHSSQQLEDTANFLYIHQVNTVYADVSVWASIVQNPNAAQKTQQEKKLTESLEQYVAIMHKHGIRVFVSGGDTDWSKPALRKDPLAIQQFAFDYNKNHPVKLSGIEFDIEAYNQDQFPEASFTEKELVLNEYLDTVDQLATQQASYAKQTGDSAMELGFAIPYWFDNENQNIKSVSWHDKTGPVLFHILDRLNSLPHSNVVVMAYRNAASGNDGMVYHARTEVEYAAAKAPHVSVLIGIEVNNVEPAKITFYGRTYTEISSEVKVLNTEFAADKVYRGIAINDLPGYQALKPDNKVIP